jgi:hypothetical protein
MGDIMTELNSDEDRKTFAIESSHKDADKSTETIRATAQAAILINGGAATAVLAFLSKDGIDTNIYHAAPISLLGYVLGVVAGFAALYRSFRSLDEYQIRWRLRAHPEPGQTEEEHRAKAFRWWQGMRACFLLTMLAFVAGSAAIAVVIRSSEPPKKITSSDSASTVTVFPKSK